MSKTWNGIEGRPCDSYKRAPEEMEDVCTCGYYKSDHRPAPPKLDGVTRFRISTHSNGYYCVSIPDYYGGEVVSAANYDAARQLITRLTEALAEIAELDGDNDNQQFKLTRFQAAQIARRAYHAAVAKERAL